jgi:lipopolysaccharide transport system permease protein
MTQSRPNPLALAKHDDRAIKIIRPYQNWMVLLGEGARSLWRHRSLLLEMTLLRLKVRYKQSFLGWIWAVLPPLLLMISYTVVFSNIIGLRSDNIPYALFIFAGLVPWTFFSTSVSAATAGIVTHRHLIARVSFPREVIPLSYVAAVLVDLLIGILMLTAMMFYFGFHPTTHALFVIVVTGILIVFTAAIALCCAAFQARFRDVGAAVPLLLQVLMFTTPTVYSSVVVPPNLKEIYFLNPMAIVVESFRQSAVLGAIPSVRELSYCGSISVICLLLSYLLFKRLDATLADVV